MATTKTQQVTVDRLANIAASMRACVNSGAKFAHHRQAHGLELVLQRRGRGWRLALGREAVQASETEIKLWRAAFGVPDGSEESSQVKASKMPNTRHTVQVYGTDVNCTDME